MTLPTTHVARAPLFLSIFVGALALVGAACTSEPAGSSAPEGDEGAGDEGNVAQASSALMYGWQIASECTAVNQLLNADFSARAMPTSQTTTPESPTLTRDSAAGSWYARNGAAGTTTTEVVDTKEGTMLHVTTTARNSGVLQQFMGLGAGIPVAAAASYVRVVSGEVGLVLGATGQGGTGDTAKSTDCFLCLLPPLTHQHPLEPSVSLPIPIYSRANDSAPANQFGILSIGGPAEFYVFKPWVTSCSGYRVMGSRLTSVRTTGATCPATLTASGEIDVVGSGNVRYLLGTPIPPDPRFPGVSFLWRGEGNVTATGTGTYPFTTTFRASRKVESSSVAVFVRGPNNRGFSPAVDYSATCSVRPW
ncbi:MAG: hypothetical protein JST00_20975 [Deltaproteobacteria bacterium]|nr:hypothetical protein [Deltaproteobacteria bacterium]